MVLWTPEKDQQVLAYFYDLCKGKGDIDWDELAERIGGDATASGVRQHVQKLRWRKPGDSPQTPTKSGGIRKANTNTATPTQAKRGRRRKGAKENVAPAERSSPAGHDDEEE
ncbi:uncharacterized protein N7459_004487 [Penicillium hispanicum]|uniref:uncharacterized protein n=1 Tax=Penicillium hispanicum TaxID=1080232 RepID=UPI0025416D8D|nr:uncharacterized protein N7459_004487 [Penicillium hispanicum]KAJ5584687.1 hypothetical protein N7459_004487 [Penicillium hispanicum]